MATHLRTWSTYYRISGGGSPTDIYKFDAYGQIAVYLEGQNYEANTSNIRIDHRTIIWRHAYASPLSFAEVTNTSSYRANNGSFGGSYKSKSGSYTQYGDGKAASVTKSMGSTYHTVYHNADGSATLYVNGSATIYLKINDPEGFDTFPAKAMTSSFIMDLPTIPRYANITSYSVVNNGLNSIRVTWNTDASCDTSQYSLNGGAWQNAPAWKDFTIGNLNPGTTYSVKIRVRRKDSQLWTESSVKYATTTDIAKITSAPDNIIMGNNITVNYSNPSGSPLSISIYKTDGMTAIAPYRACSGTSYTFTLTEAEKNNMYNSIPTTNDTRFRIYIRTEADKNYLYYVERKFILTNANPIFSNFAYEDINTKTTGLTGNNQTIIKGYSTLRAIISTSNKAVAQKGANMVSYQLVVGEKQKTVAYSDSTDVNIDLTEIENNIFTVYAIDSRGNSTTKQISPTEYIAYSKVVLLNGQAERTGGIGDETTLKFNGTFYNVDFGSSSNSLTITYKYKKTSLPDLEENWVDGTTTITPSITDNNFSFENIIAGDKGALGFDSQYSYNIKIIATDKLSSDEYDLMLGTGKPNIAIHRKGTAFGAPYDEELEGFQIVDKKITFNGLELFKWVEEEEE